jgi:uncharacterized membrane protein
MTPKRFYLLMLLGAAIVVAVTIGFYPYLPPQMASHWSGGPTPDSSMPKRAFVVFLPFLALFIPMFVSVMAFAVKQTRPRAYAPLAALALVIYLFFLYVHLLVLLWNVGVRFSMNDTMRVGGAAFLLGIALCIGWAVYRVRR